MKRSFRSLISKIYQLIKLLVGQKNAEKIKRMIFICLGKIPPRHTNNKDYVRLVNIIKEHKPIKLHFGADIRVLKGWVNLDIVPYHTSDDYSFSDRPEERGGRDDYFQVDFCEGPLPLPDNSVELIFHEDFIEHLTQKETVLFLAETFRVLKSGGIHRINTPELIPSLKKHCDFNKGFSGVNTMEWDRYGHHQVLTRNFLKELAGAVGYREIIFNARDKSVAGNIPKEYRPGDDRRDEEQIFCDLIK